jgi:hypothetical protein
MGFCGRELVWRSVKLAKAIQVVFPVKHMKYEVFLSTGKAWFARIAEFREHNSQHLD